VYPRFASLAAEHSTRGYHDTSSGADSWDQAGFEQIELIQYKGCTMRFCTEFRQIIGEKWALIFQSTSSINNLDGIGRGLSHDESTDAVLRGEIPPAARPRNFSSSTKWELVMRNSSHHSAVAS